MLNSRNILVCLIALLASTFALAQGPTGSAAATPPVAYASVSELNAILTPLQQTAQSMQSDLTKMRIEKWKTDGATKKQTLANVDSIQRNLQSALPETLAQLNGSPEDLGASFKLYRNLDALYDVFGSVVESAGAFGSKDEFQSLSHDMTALETARRSFGERMQKLAATKEDELTRLRVQVKTLSEPPAKPVKKKTTKPKPPAAATTAPPQ